MYLYKGAGPGSHWCQQDARISGFVAGKPGATSLGDLVQHIAHGVSHASAYISFSSSYDVAWTYACSGPRGEATRTNHGFVYVVDTEKAPPGSPFVYPAQELSGRPEDLTHDGSPNLALGILEPFRYRYFLQTPPLRRGNPPTHQPPSFKQELKALFFALRDSEVLVHNRLDKACIVGREVIP